ncbi:DUF1616 domain-containing protein [Natronorubrum halophilum]|uniref:DUF1616 domain-containing protein n=1 Tax=Natronorubrum halophilum TaxID=1702106 RepID=UPI000EF64B97|nr:DUF1616 domain-containing protein [Natronorubrum halophilum]
MIDAKSLWLILPRQIRELPADLIAVLIVVAATNAAALLPVVRETPIRVPLGLAFLLFLPGYAFVAALFPEASERSRSGDETDGSNGSEAESPDFDNGSALLGTTSITGIERGALSFGLSVAIVPLIALLLDFTLRRPSLTSILIVTSAFVVLSSIVAGIRRWNLSPENRFAVPYRLWIESGRERVFGSDSRGTVIVNVLLVASVLLALGTVGYAIAVPQDGERFSSAYILVENDGGELVADGYPTEYDSGESREIVFGIDNQEHRTVDYTTVFAIQEIETQNNETIVIEQEELDRFEAQLAHGESWHHDHEIDPTMTGENLRLVWLVYLDGEPPDEPTLENADRSVDLWIDVDE